MHTYIPIPKYVFVCFAFFLVADPTPNFDLRQLLVICLHFIKYRNYALCYIVLCVYVHSSEKFSDSLSRLYICQYFIPFVWLEQ